MFTLIIAIASFILGVGVGGFAVWYCITSAILDSMRTLF